MKKSLVKKTAGLKKALAAKAAAAATAEIIARVGALVEAYRAKRGLVSSIPQKDAELVPWVGTFNLFLLANITKGGFLAAKVAKNVTAGGTYISAVEALEGGNASPLLLARKEAAKAVIVAGCAGFITFELCNPVFSDADLLEAGVKVGKKTIDRDKKIVVIPAWEFLAKFRNEVTIRSFCSGTIIFNIPRDKGCRVIGYCGAVREASTSPVPLAKDCPITGTSTRHKFTIKFPEGSSGKYFVLYLRYTNNFTEPGSWSGPSGTTIL